MGRDVEGRWTSQIVEGFDDHYGAARAEVLRLEQRLVDSRRHAHEHMMRERRRTERPPFLIDA